MALTYFAREIGAGKDKRVVLVVDQAGWHTGKEVEVPEEDVQLEFLPARSPELQSPPKGFLAADQRSGGQPPIREPRRAGRSAGRALCVSLVGDPELIRSHTNYPWWPHAA
jgi:hypothetical protein